MPFDERIYFEIGRVAAEWSRLEDGTRSALWLLVSGGGPLLHQPSQVLIAGMALSAQWDAIETLLKTPPTADPEALTWFKEWRNRADHNLRPRRNDAVHSVWAIDGNDEEITALAIDNSSRKAREGPRWDVVPGGKLAVAELAEEIAEHRRLLSKWTSEQFRRLWPSARESGEHVPQAVPTVTRFDITPEP